MPLRQPNDWPSENIKGLEDGWSDFNSKAPTDAVIELAEKIERALWFVPINDGGMQMEIHAGGVDLEIVFGPDAQPTSLSIDREGQK